MQASVSKLEARAAGLVRVFNRRLHGACYASGGNRMGSTFQYPALHIYVIAGERFSNQMLVARAPLGFSGRLCAGCNALGYPQNCGGSWFSVFGDVGRPQDYLGQYRAGKN